jgi:hypothetical protein
VLDQRNKERAPGPRVGISKQNIWPQRAQTAGEISPIFVQRTRMSPFLLEFCFAQTLMSRPLVGLQISDHISVTAFLSQVESRHSVFSLSLDVGSLLDEKFYDF